MLNTQLIMGLEEYEVLDVKPGQITLVKAKSPGNRVCIYCQKDGCRIKDTVERNVKFARVHQTIIVLEVEAKKLYCKTCKRSFHERLPGVLPRYRGGEAFRQQVFEDHQAGHTQKHLSRTHKVGESTIGRWNRSYLIKRNKETQSARLVCPKVMGIDEHFFTRKKGYATTFVDLKGRKVFDIVLGRSEESLRDYVLKLQGRDRVEVVTIDLSEPYRALIKKYFPNAKIVADRFHVVRTVYRAFMKVWREIHPEVSYNRGLLTLIRKASHRLSEEQKKNLDSYLNSEPILKILYEKREEILAKIRLKSIGEYGAREHIKEYLQLVDDLHSSPWPPLQQLGRTLKSWSEEIVRMWRFKRNNGMTEGFHNKMELISRRAYGFRNFQNYRMRVLALCGWDGLFAYRGRSSIQKLNRLTQ